MLQRYKIPNTSHFINTKESNRLTKTGFDARMKQKVKILASKTEVENALDLEDKNRNKWKHLKRLIQFVYLLKGFLKMIIAHKII